MLDSYQPILDRLNLHGELPYTPDWSAAADFIDIIVNHCLQSKPTTILECSSGLTTLMLARCCQINGSGRVISLEDGIEYADNTRRYIQSHGLEHYADVRHAVLEKVEVNGEEYLWYSTTALPDTTIDMLVIDGPSGFLQKHSRYPALPMLYDRLGDHCTVFLDDAGRIDEKEIVQLWLNYPELTHEYFDTERGCSVLNRNR